MESAFASGLLNVAGGKLVSLMAREITSITGVTRDLSELQDIHQDITRWLSDVRDRSIESGPSPPRMMKLRNVAYDIHDLLDEVQLQADKHNIDSDSDKHAIADCFCMKPKSFQFRWKVARKIREIRVTYQAIVNQTSNTNTVVPNAPVPIESSNVTTGEPSFLGKVPDSQIPKRDQEKADIICKLLESNEGEKSWIISVVGLGGSGKTTLAKHICHDNKIKEHFKDEIFWVHVSQEFGIEKLIGKLFEALGSKQKSDHYATQHMLHEISKKLGGKKFLLVLDDAWQKERHEWEQFMPHLTGGAPGSKILLTTRDEKVAYAVKSKNTCKLSFLAEDESWSFFLKSSELAENDLDPKLIQVGKETVEKCGGVPLAIKTLGGIFCEKRELSTWEAIRGSDLWNEQSINDKVFASLKLSYIHLADELKQCFVFCSIFPKGYQIYKDRLISRWIAHGYINPKNGEHPEDIGKYYFDSLVKVGFLQDPSESWTKQLVCKMHDLIHDLARHILKDEVVNSLHNNMTTKFTQGCRYLSLTLCTEKVNRHLLDRARDLYVSGGAPSFDKLVKKSFSIRSVILNYTSDTPFPMFILKFEYLGYLEICGLKCTELPEAIAGCWNLQALCFINCNGFVALPESISKLKKLRNLELQNCTDLESLPQSIGGCRDLQCLQLYICEKLKEIPSSIDRLENLRVLNMVDIRSLQQMPTASGELSNLQIISFAGCSGFLALPSTFSCHRLHTLNLSETKVTTIPEWVTSIDTLECIDLKNCSELVKLPSGIGNLKRLRVLCLKWCSKLRCMPPGLQQLTRLSTLGLFVVGCSGDVARISELENLDMISGDMIISNLKYVNDPSDAEKACLNRKSNIQSLELDWSVASMEEELVSGNQQDLDLLRALEPPSEVKTLEIRGYRGPYLPHWFGEESESSYREGKLLNITGTSKFLCLTELRLAKLQNLEHLRGLLVLPSLKSFSLQGMPNLEELWTTTTGSEIGEEESGARYCFPVLSDLVIKQCPKLIVLPCFPPSLEHLWLADSNKQLLSAGSSSSCQLPLPSCSANLAVPHLKELDLWTMTGSSSGWERLQRFIGLEDLRINHCTDLTKLPESIRSLTSLRQLTIWGCTALGELPEWLGELRSLRDLRVWSTPMITGLPQSTEHLTSLVKLSIDGWENLKELPEVMQHLTSLQDLRMVRCRALTVLPEWIGQLSALHTLWIVNCSALQSLPRSIKHLTALQQLGISGCPGLAERYKEGVGNDWDLVSHIPDVRIWD